ncbi:MAG TPA: ribosome small subunit-dependent GTPase A [Bacteroidales bacterium]|nr:ribosome small subunit-dependent GTPase A [Bacteroidales bacterium]
MELEDLGFNAELERFRIDNNLETFVTGRVVSEHKERYIVRTIERTYEAEITGNLRFTAKSREDFPAVGDWVALQTYDSNLAIIHAIFPRYSILKRQAVDQVAEIQLIATNIDDAFLVQAVDRDFNINRLERYLTICNASRIRPIIVLSKIDLISELELNEFVTSVQERIENVPIIAISNDTQNGYNAINSYIEKGKTYCLLGSSGVGKSTLINNLTGKMAMKTDSISKSTNKGRHITSHRELFVLDQGGILIDNPGMKEVGITNADVGLEQTFNVIHLLSKDCKFVDCTHTKELGCAVLRAIKNGEIDSRDYENFLKLQKEMVYFESSVEEKRKKDKDFGKMVKNFKKNLVSQNKNEK